MKLNGDFTGAGQVPGALSSANTLPTVDRQLRAVTSLAARMTYTSTSGIDDGHTEVTGSVFVPRGKAPDGGWPIVALGHSATGVQPECAPSLSPTLLNNVALVTILVEAGYLVTLTDYQGLGDDKLYHPFLDSTTEGNNLIDSVKAARKLVPDASDRWVAFGLSQGGQAAWAANELASNYQDGLTLLGSVSVSPPADIIGFADAAAAGDLTKDQLPYLQWILVALDNEYNDFNLDDYRHGLVQDKWDVLSACSGTAADERAKLLDQITPDDLRPSTPQAVDTLRGYLRKMNLPQGPAAAPMLVYYGGRDSLLPSAWTDRALLAACKMGDVIDIEFQPGKGHGDIDPSQAFAWLQARFSGDPAPNSCDGLLADQPPPESTPPPAPEPTDTPDQTYIPPRATATTTTTATTAPATTATTTTASTTATTAPATTSAPATTTAAPAEGPLPGPAPGPAPGPVPEPAAAGN
jgi:Secretory lipase